MLQDRRFCRYDGGGGPRMSNFEFVFSLFGLVLGLALAEVLGGFGTAFQSRRKVRVGWLTPLLGLFVALDLASFWTLAWSVRDDIPADYFSMMTGLVITSLYYLVARLVFPGDRDEWPDFDAYYFAHKRWVLGGVLLCNALAMAAQVAIGYRPLEVPLFLWGTILFVVLLVAAMIARSPRANAVLLVLLTLAYPVIAMIAIATGVN